MREYEIRGNLRWMKNDDKTLMKYRIRKSYGYFELDDLLWGNVGNDVRLTVKDCNNNILFDEDGVLEVDFKYGYSRYSINGQDLDMILFNNINQDIIINIYNFEYEAMTQEETDEEWENITWI